MAGETKGSGEPMNQKFYTLEESLLEQSADSPKPKRKRLARASPQVPASVSSGRQDDSAVRQPLNQRFYSDSTLQNDKFEGEIQSDSFSSAQYESQASSFMTADAIRDGDVFGQKIHPNRWVYSANAPRKGDAQFNADLTDEAFDVEQIEHPF